MHIKFILILMSFCTCYSYAKDFRGKQDKQLIEIAENLIKDKYPTSYEERDLHEYLIEDKLDTWEISWKSRKGIVEGTPVVVISKKTLQVVKYWHYQ